MKHNNIFERTANFFMKLMTNNIRLLLIALLGTGLSFNAYAGKNSLAYENFVKTDILESVSSLRISLNTKSLTGFVIVPICNYVCTDTKLTITPKTTAFYKNDEVPLVRAKDRLGRFVEIIYEVESKKVVQISW